MKRLLAAAFSLSLMAAPAAAQTVVAQTTNLSALITTGNTFQQIAPAVTGNAQRKSLTIENNNASDTCYLLIGQPFQAGDTTATTRSVNGTTMAATKAAISLAPGGAYTRYYPYIPNDIILATCATTGDSLYVDTQ
jgi:hypothetical protein